MARNTNQGKGVGGIQKPNMRKKKELFRQKDANRKRDLDNKNKSSH
jgi:hypothetical protein